VTSDTREPAFAIKATPRSELNESHAVKLLITARKFFQLLEQSINLPWRIKAINDTDQYIGAGSGPLPGSAAGKEFFPRRRAIGAERVTSLLGGLTGVKASDTSAIRKPLFHIFSVRTIEREI
jgi:hypothetical protein